MGKVFIFDHPLMSVKLSIIRDEKTNTKEFRQVVREIANLMTYEATKDLDTVNIDVKTPCGIARCKHLKKDVVIVPILQPQSYYTKFPENVSEATVLLVDPMLATGGSVAYSIDVLKEAGVKEIIYMGIVGAPEGLKKITEAHPDVDVYLAALDEKLNEKGYIVPGLGDCGDRLFGTK